MPEPTPKGPHPGSAALLSKFATEQERREYFRHLARSSHERRLVVTDEQAAVLSEAYGVLGDILRRHRAKQTAAPSPGPEGSKAA
jgi:hypothetical protein